MVTVENSVVCGRYAAVAVCIAGVSEESDDCTCVVGGLVMSVFTDAVSFDVTT